MDSELYLLDRHPFEVVVRDVHDSNTSSNVDMVHATCRLLCDTVPAAWRRCGGFSADSIPRPGMSAKTKGQAKTCLACGFGVVRRQGFEPRTHTFGAFDGQYVREYVIHGYAVTVHTAQGATANTTHAVLSETATRTMSYVAMTRGQDANTAYLYQRTPEHEYRTEPREATHSTTRKQPDRGEPVPHNRGQRHASPDRP